LKGEERGREEGEGYISNLVARIVESQRYVRS